MISFKVTDGILNAIKFPYGFNGKEPHYSLNIAPDNICVGASMLGGVKIWARIPMKIDISESINFGLSDRLKNLPTANYDVSINDTQVIFLPEGNKSKYIFPKIINNDIFIEPTSNYSGSIPLVFSELFKSFEKISSKVNGAFPMYINKQDIVYNIGASIVCIGNWDEPLNLIGDNLTIKYGIFPLMRYFSLLSQNKGDVLYTKDSNNFCTFKYCDADGICYYLQIPTEVVLRKHRLPDIPTESFTIDKNFWDSMQVLYNLSGSTCQTLVQEKDICYITDIQGSRHEVNITGDVPEKFTYSVEDTKNYIPQIPLGITLTSNVACYKYTASAFNITIILARISGD